MTGNRLVKSGRKDLKKANECVTRHRMFTRKLGIQDEYRYSSYQFTSYRMKLSPNGPLLPIRNIMT